MALGDKSLQGADGDGQVKLPPPTGGLARMSTNAPTNRGERIRDPGVAVSLLVPTPRNERDVASGLGVHWTRLHAGEVRFEPFEVDEFGSAGHEVCPGSLSTLLLDRQFHRRCRGADIHRLRGWFTIFAPGLHRVLARGDILDFE